MSGQMKNWRACMVCSVCQPYNKFTSQGCPNCEHFLEMRGQPDVVTDCTSAVFEGVITLADPDSSWVAKWQRLVGYHPGIYATKVVGTLAEEYVAAAENAGVKYVPFVFKPLPLDGHELTGKQARWQRN